MKILSATMLSLTVFSGVYAEAWLPSSNPYMINRNYQANFSKLPIEAELGLNAMPWASSWWPSFLGGIAFRWNATEPMPFKYKSPNKKEAARMSYQELAELSPAEKWDLYLGNYNYPLKSKMFRKYNPTNQTWEGICHGWSSASINYYEPAPKELVNPDGVVVPFGSADFKALLSYSDTQSIKKNSVQVGRRCAIDLEKNPAGINHPDCGDINPGSFHIILANQIGLIQRGFIVDVDRGTEVWNQPVHKYVSEIVSRSKKVDPTAAKGTVTEVQIKTSMTYTDDGDYTPEEFNAFWDKDTGTPAFIKEHRDYEYILELDASDKIIGGRWVSLERPDFAWYKQFAGFKSNFSKLADHVQIR